MDSAFREDTNSIEREATESNKGNCISQGKVPKQVFPLERAVEVDCVGDLVGTTSSCSFCLIQLRG